MQPYELESQILVNEALVDLGEELGIKCVMTADSHYVRKQDYDTYLMMHKVSGSDPMADYSRRYLPSSKDQRVLMQYRHF